MLCKYIIAIFAAAYGVALLVYFTGIFGWFGQDTDPLSGIFLIPLGLPWIWLDVPENIAPVFGACAPLINLGLIWMLCRKFAP